MKTDNLSNLRTLIEKYESEQVYPSPIHKISLPFAPEQILIVFNSLKLEMRDLTIKNAKLEEKLEIIAIKNSKILESHVLEKLKFEETIARNLTMIENILKDKQLLNEEIEKILIEKKASEQKNQELTDFFREKIKNELKLQKEYLENLEKKRRKQWQNEKTKEIKEITVRGLEPELSKIIESHKKEIKNLEDKMQAEREKLYEEFDNLKKKMFFDLQHKEETIKRNYEKIFEEELKKKEIYWKNEKELISKMFENELNQKETQRKIEAENFSLKIQLLQEKK